MNIFREISRKPWEAAQSELDNASAGGTYAMPSVTVGLRVFLGVVTVVFTLTVVAYTDRMAERFKLGREQWLDLLERERGINRQEYARDVLWPTLALRKLAADRLEVAPAELNRAYEMQFGPAVRARLVVVSNRQKADELHRQLVARPDEFARLAMDHSEDVNSASIGGLIHPIRRHCTLNQCGAPVGGSMSSLSGMAIHALPPAESLSVTTVQRSMS